MKQYLVRVVWYDGDNAHTVDFFLMSDGKTVNGRSLKLIEDYINGRGEILLIDPIKETA